MLDKPKKYYGSTEPLPTPPLESRPRKLSVSRVETWIRDPYSIYAQQILKLRVLDPINAELDASNRGIVVHEALDRFVKKFPANLPEDAYQKLLDIGTQLFDERIQNSFK